MNSRLAIAVLVVVSCAGTSRTSLAETRIVALFDIEDMTGKLSARDRQQLTEYLSSNIAEGGRFQVIPSSQLKARLVEKKKESYKGCYDQKCQIEIGRELAAQKTLATKVLKVGSRCAVVITLYDLKKAATERSANVKGGCSVDALVSALEQAAKKIKAGPGATSSARPTPPTVQPAPTAPPTARAPASADADWSSPFGKEQTSARAAGNDPVPAPGRKVEWVEDRRGSWMGYIKWVTAALAVGALGAGVATGMTATNKATELEDAFKEGNPNLDSPVISYSKVHHDLQAEFDTLQEVSISMFVVGGVMAGVTVLLAILDSKRNKKIAVQRAGLELLPVLGPQVMGVGASIRF